MDLHLIGHASLFIKTTDLSILMDPVLWDPHQEGLFDVYPKRRVLHDRLPDFDLMIISHRHLDHFDIRSLAYLPKNASVLIPKDSLIENYLRKLGYSNIRPLADFSEVTIGGTRLLTTRSENPVPEFGIVIADDSGVLWNQVDTVVTPKTVKMVQSRFDVVDLLVAAWQPMLEDSFQTNKSLSFPYERYNDLLYNIGLVSPRALMPGANAFCYTGGASWLNRIVFPITRERFVHDVLSVAPSVGANIFPADPGDRITLKHGEYHHQEGGCDFVARLETDRISLNFAPVTAEPQLRDENLDHVPEHQLEAAATKTIEIELAEFVRAKHRLFVEHQRWKVIWQIEVVLPSRTLAWVVDFVQTIPQISKGHSPLANSFAYITASSLHGLVNRTRGWDYAYLGGYYRSFEKIYSVSPCGLIRRGEGSLSDPLALMYPYNDILTSILDREVEKWATPRVDVKV